MNSKSKLILAQSKGYYIDKLGIIYSKRGVVKGNINKKGYRMFIMRSNNRLYNVATHRLVGYQKFGDKIFETNMLIRHLNGNPSDNSYDNIGIGTPSDNMMDIDKKIRQLRSKQANKKYSEETIELWRKEHMSGISYKNLSIKYSIGKSMLSYYLGKADRKRQVVILD